nr:MAG TPA: hypothetical protein [Caudoviricetes sp.]
MADARQSISNTCRLVTEHVFAFSIVSEFYRVDVAA